MLDFICDKSNKQDKSNWKNIYNNETIFILKHPTIQEIVGRQGDVYNATNMESIFIVMVRLAVFLQADNRKKFCDQGVRICRRYLNKY